MAIALFGEAEKGQFRKGCYCESLDQLMDLFGHPPEDSQGIPLAIQALLHEKAIIFFRVREEGFSSKDYFSGLNLLDDQGRRYPLSAIALPGVGDGEIIQRTASICLERRSLLITTEADLYDYLTGGQV